MNCERCGREDGHYLGCEMAGKPYVVAPIGGKTIEGDPPEGTEPCAFAGCSNMRASRHPKALFCAKHKDPKNRKV